jgi:hypothetical protein
MSGRQEYSLTSSVIHYGLAVRIAKPIRTFSSEGQIELLTLAA